MNSRENNHKTFAILFLLNYFLCSINTIHSQITLPNAGKTNQPLPFSTKPIVKVEAVPQYKDTFSSQKLVIAVVLDIPKDWHLYANPKQGQFGLDTEILPQPTDGIDFGQPIYPPGWLLEDKNLNARNYIYTDRTICYLPITVTAKTEGQFSINIILKGLLCSENGACVPWSDTISCQIHVSVTPTPLQPNRPELFNDFAPQTTPQHNLPTLPGSKSLSADDWLTPILLAVAAGLMMNLMPCVLPLIPIIVLTLIKQCATDNDKPNRGQSLRVGLAFAAGILAVFAALAILMSSFKLIWGQQFQSNGFKLALLLIVYVLSLSMFGLFEIVLPAKLSNISIVRKGLLGTFAMGILTTVLATPCGAPLLTPVLTWSLAKPLSITVAVFLIIGAGMAVPYVLLTAFPNLLARVPKAGNWMIRLKQIIGFAMLAYAVYLALLFPPHWLKPLLYFCLLLGFCIWLGFSLVNHNTPAARRFAVRLLAAAIIIVASVWLNQAVKPQPITEISNTITNEKPTIETWLTQLQTCKLQKQTAIVKFTANWCKNCAVLDQTIYHNDAFRNKLTETRAKLIIADWSSTDDDIKKMITELGGPGQSLPFAAVFPANDPDHPILLRDFYSLADTLNALDEASKR